MAGISSLVQRVAHRVVRRSQPPGTFEDVIRCRLKPDFFFIQIGAFDGRTGDPIHDFIVRHGWAGVLVEPRRRYFEELQATYRDQPGLILKQAAVFEEPGIQTMYGLRADPELPDWAPQVAVFDRDLLALTQIPNIDAYVEEESVECVTLGSLLDMTPSGQVDLLQIDAEGYDAEILGMLDLDQCLPTVIHFEHHALDQHVHQAVLARLCRYGYQTLVEAKDTTAWT